MPNFIDLVTLHFSKIEERKNMIYNQNIKLFLNEDPEDLEFDGVSPLTDTSVYYFIDDFEEFDADLVYDDEEEYEEDTDDEGEELDFTGGFDFFNFCATLGIKLPRFDEALITYKE